MSFPFRSHSLERYLASSFYEISRYFAKNKPLDKISKRCNRPISSIDRPRPRRRGWFERILRMVEIAIMLLLGEQQLERSLNGSDAD